MDIKVDYTNFISSILSRPMKKGGTSAGIPRASGERSPAANGTAIKEVRQTIHLVFLGPHLYVASASPSLIAWAVKFR
jgi:hypothetical protein